METPSRSYVRRRRRQWHRGVSSHASEWSDEDDEDADEHKYEDEDEEEEYDDAAAVDLMLSMQ